MHQLFIAPMICPVCGLTTPADTSTNMQVGEFPCSTDPPLYINVGDRFHMGFKHVTAAGFKTLAKEAPGRSFRLLQPWHCPNCNTDDLWAKVEFVNDGEWAEVASIQTVDRSPETLDQVDAVSNLIVNQHAFGIEDWLPVVKAAVVKK
jgi:hypothetical protein